MKAQNTSEKRHSTFFWAHHILSAPWSMTPCLLKVSESSQLFWDGDVGRAAVSLITLHSQGGLPGSSALLVLTFRSPWINETSCGGMTEFHSSNLHSSHLAHAIYSLMGTRGLWDIFRWISPWEDLQSKAQPLGASKCSLFDTHFKTL